MSAFLANMLGSVNPEELGNTLWTDLRERAAAARRKSGATEAEVSASLASLDKALAGVSSTQSGLKLLDEQIPLLVPGRPSPPRWRVSRGLPDGWRTRSARTYLLLGLLPQAETHLKAAVEIRTRAFGTDSPDTLKSMRALGLVYGRQGKLPEAEKIARECPGDTPPGRPAPSTRTPSLRCRPWARLLLGAAIRAGREAPSRVPRGEAARPRPDHRDTRSVYIALGMVLSELKRYPEREAAAREVEFDRKAGTSNEPDAIGTVMNLAICYEQQGDLPSRGSSRRRSLLVFRSGSGQITRTPCTR